MKTIFVEVKFLSVLPDYVELTNPDKGFRTYMHWLIKI